MTEHTQAMLDDVAVYALGAMPAAEAERVRRHIATCPQCASEYAALAPAVTAVASSAATVSVGAGPSPLLKSRIMHAVRSGSTPSARTPERAQRTPVWPAYLVAAACFAIAIVTAMWNVALLGQIKQTQAELARTSQRSNALAHNLADERATISDLLDSSAKHFTAGSDEVITHGTHLYVAMRDLPEPPRGKVYQAWTLAKGGKKMTPQPTFVPDAHGVALIALPVNANDTAAVAVSIEPEGGSKQPTSKPVLLVPLT